MPLSNVFYLVAALLISTALSGCQQIGKLSNRKLSRSAVRNKAAATDVQLALAQSLERKGKLDDAISVFERLANEKGIPTAMHRLGVLFDQKGEFEKARVNYDNALKHLPNDAQLWCDAGYSYYLQENWEASEAHLTHALELNPDLDRAHNNLGLLMARLGKVDKALAAFQAATDDAEAARANLDFVLANHEEPYLPFDASQISDNVAFNEAPREKRQSSHNVAVAEVPDDAVDILPSTDEHVEDKQNLQQVSWEGMNSAAELIKRMSR